MWFEKRQFTDTSAFLLKTVCIMLVSLYLMELFSERFPLTYIAHHLATVIIVCLLVDFAVRPLTLIDDGVGTGLMCFSFSLFFFAAYFHFLRTNKRK